MRTLLATGAVLVAFGASAAPAMAGACASADASASAVTPQRLANATVCLLNQERAKHHLPKLRTNRRLALAATRHAKDMAARHYFSHDTLGGGDFADRIQRTGYSSGNASLGENLAWGSGNLGSPRQIVEAWMASPGHRRNILFRRFREVGIGVAMGDPGAGQTGATYASEFGSGGKR